MQIMKNEGHFSPESAAIGRKYIAFDHTLQSITSERVARTI